MRKIYFLMMMIIITSVSYSQVTMTTTGSYSQDFNILPASGSATWVNNSSISNWYHQRSGTGTTIVANDGVSNAGNLYSYGTGTATERALGVLNSGNAAIGNMANGVLLRNTSGTTITSITVSYVGEQWRNSAAAAQTVTFYYQTSSSAISLLDPNVSTGWTNVAALNFTSPITGGTASPLNGNLAANRVAISSTIPSLSLANNDYIMLKWDDPDHTGADHGLSIDDVSISWTVTPSGNSSSAFIFSDNLVFAPLTNIPYKDYQATDITAANSAELGLFFINDGSADADNLGTILTDLTFSVTNSAVLRRVALYTQGGVEIAEVAAGPTITFNGLNITANDGSIQTFYLRATFNAPVVDNTQTILTITSATADPAGSTFAAPDAGGAATFSNGDENRIAVIADRLAFVQNVNTPTVPVNVAISPAPSVEAVDILGSRDLDYTSIISLTAPGGTLPAPININAVAGFATFSSVILTATSTHTRLGVNAGSLLTALSNEFAVVFASGLTDRFRSAVATGDWNTAASWESSPDNVTWSASTLVPNENANTITIRNGHTITISSAITADQVVIENGGVLTNSAGVFTINDGTGDDVTIQDGGIFTLATTAGPAFTGSAAVNVNGNGILRVSRTGYTSAGAGMNSPNYVYQNGAIAEYTLSSAFSTSGVTFFPNADAATIPVFRFTGSSVSAGSSGTTTFNGVFEAVGNVTFTGTGVKTFRNGITGTGNFSGAGSGKFIINGATAALGGGGTLTLPTTDGLEIAAGSILTLNSSKTIAGNISLLANSFIVLGNNDLTITGAIAGGAADRYVRTNGTGVLTINNITTTPVVLPVGNSTYNPLSITNGSGLNWSARVEDAVNNVTAPFNTDKAINRTWHIAPSAAVTTGPDITLSFDDSDPGQLANPSAYATDGNRLARFWHYSGAWVSASGSMPMTATAGPQSLTLIGYTNFSPFAIAKTTGALPVAFGNIRAMQQGSGVKIEWSNYTESDVLNYTVERSADGRQFTSVGAIAPRLNDGSRADYNVIDALPVNGVNYYRVRSAETNGQVKYSSVARVDLRGGSAGISIYPNPLTGSNLLLQATSLAKGLYNIKIFNAAGQQVAGQVLNHNGGSVTGPVLLPAALKAGLYQLVITGDAINVTKTFVVQ
jgi:hypothetical protein